jgi:sugar/nucleoside kinase (ribokinase family)
VLKLGNKGAIFITDGDVLKTPSAKVKCVDPTGAGDAFNAGVIYGLTNEMSFEQTGRIANWFAAQTVMQFGARTFPTKARIRKFLSKPELKIGK